jgi:hypothetical protein
MKSILSGFVLFLLGSTIGCEHVTSFRDFTPPDSPRHVTTEAGDGSIDVYWNASTQSDVAGYNVFVSSSYDGRYDLIGSTSGLQFTDNGARNGNTYYYAVTAFDFDGNESDLSTEEAYDIPRPEGYGLILNNYRQSPAGSGYDFSDFATLPYTDQTVDMYFESFEGRYYMNVPQDTDIRDMGATASILDIRVAPSSGWSSTGDVELQPGRTYVVWTWDDHYAKFRVRSVSPSRVVFDWAYQLQRSNPLLKRAAPPEGTRHMALRESAR